MIYEHRRLYHETYRHVKSNYSDSHMHYHKYVCRMMFVFETALVIYGLSTFPCVELTFFEQLDLEQSWTCTDAIYFTNLWSSPWMLHKAPWLMMDVHHVPMDMMILNTLVASTPVDGSFWSPLEVSWSHFWWLTEIWNATTYHVHLETWKPANIGTGIEVGMRKDVLNCETKELYRSHHLFNPTSHKDNLADTCMKSPNIYNLKERLFRKRVFWLRHKVARKLPSTTVSIVSLKHVWEIITQ